MGGLLLVIDDDPVEREILERVLLDLMMPRLNGYQTCRALRRDPATARCPILMLTSEDETTDRFWASEVGVDDLTSRA